MSNHTSVNPITSKRVAEGDQTKTICTGPFVNSYFLLFFGDSIGTGLYKSDLTSFYYHLKKKKKIHLEPGLYCTSR